jgi:hypothetical protein
MRNLLPTLIILTATPLLFTTCAVYPISGDWDVELTYISVDTQNEPVETNGLSERFSLTFDKKGQVFKNGTLYGTYSRRANNRFKFFSQDRKIVFYAAFDGRHTLKGETLHIPNDHIFANWNAARRVKQKLTQ